MGDMADYMYDNITTLEVLHEQGLCDGYCPICFEELSPEEQQQILEEESCP